MNRRHFLHLAIGGSVAGAFSAQGCSPLKPDRRAGLFGFNLVAWDSRALKNPKPWQAAITSLRQIGIGRVTIVPFRLLNPNTLRLLDRSNHDLVSGPAVSTVSQIVRFARTSGMSVSVKPMIEIDNADGEGEIWRGSLKVGADMAEAFFASYTQYIRSLLHIAVEEGADRFYVGTELAGVATDRSLQSYWSSLIATCRADLGTLPCLLSYAANYDEYKRVPFWSLLDEIGIDAYFPLAQPEEARGAGRPDSGLLAQRFKEVLTDLEALSRRHERKVMLAEWGVVPFDLTTAEPSDEGPSSVADSQEAMNAYKAVIDTIREQGDWLTGVDFWHWSVSSHNDSPYSIGADHPVSGLLKAHAKRSGC